MKKLTIFISSLTIAFSIQTSFADTYVFNSSNIDHPYSLNFPQDWKVHAVTQDSYGFSPSNHKEDPVISLKEYTDVRFIDIVNEIKSDNFTVLESKDHLISSDYQDLMVKKLSFVNLETNLSLDYFFVFRGNKILAFELDNEEFTAVFEQLVSSIEFSDGNHQYINFSDSYTFTFPQKFHLKNFPSSLELLENDLVVMQFAKFADQNIDEVFALDRVNHGFQKTENQVFQHFQSPLHYFTDSSTGSTVTKIYFKRGSDVYRVTSYIDYFDPTAILNSFYFFAYDAAADYVSFLHFPDVRNDHPNATAINDLVYKKVINGYSDNTFRPDQDINRAELVKIMVAIVNTPQGNRYKNCFSDVQEQWFSPFVCYAKERNWVDGYEDKTFKPEQFINRAEALKIIIGANFKETLKDYEVNANLANIWHNFKADHWFAPYFSYAIEHNLVDMNHVEPLGDIQNFYFDQPISRKEVAELIYRSQNHIVDNI
jgi:hypothetical protein